MISTIVAIFTLLFWASVAWVYWDATANKIGKIPGEKGFTNMSAGLWSIGTLMLWIICLPLYFIKRRSLIDRAKTHPIEVKRRWLKLGIICFIGVMGANQSYNDKELDAKYATLRGQSPQNIPATQAPAVQPAPARAASTPTPTETAASTTNTTTKPREKPDVPRAASMLQPEATAPVLRNAKDFAPLPITKATSSRRVQKKTDDMDEARRRPEPVREATASIQPQAPERKCSYKPVMTEQDIANCR